MNARRWLIALVVILVIGGVLLWYLNRLPRYDFEQLGGTVLVYQIEPVQEEVNDPSLAEIMAESLQRRLDPDQRGMASVRAVDKDRIEIRVTRIKDDHAATIARVKALAARTGKLEFLMLANNHDDKDALTWATDMFQNDAGFLEEVTKGVRTGAPPPGPRDPQTREPKRFNLKLAKGERSTVTYRWIELGPNHLRTLDLDNAAEHDPQRNGTWLEAKKNRNRATTLQHSQPLDERRILRGALFYSRACQNEKLPEEERHKKAVEYFVLARDPEFDADDAAKRTPPIDGRLLTDAFAYKDRDVSFGVTFIFNAEGGRLFSNLTRKNVTVDVGADGLRLTRHLAIVLDGAVLTAPSINSEIGRRGQITGNFTQEEMEDLATILRAGALPARLKSPPVSEVEAPPVK